MFILTMMAILMLLALWLYDMNTCILSKIRSQNAADSSALTAAQWQAKSLNAVGEINLVKAIATLMDLPPPGIKLDLKLAGQTDENKFKIVQQALDNLQVRIQFVGPMMAMIAAQQAAKNNGVVEYKTYTEAVRRHAELVETTYKDAFDAPQWGDGDWSVAYAKMLNYVADQGVAVSADNVNYYDSSLNASPLASKYLLSKSFYSAIAIKDWCFIKDLLPIYDNYGIWGAITVNRRPANGNEFFNLGLTFLSSDAIVGANGLTETQLQNVRGYIEAEMIKRNTILHTDWPQFVPPIQWAVYDPEYWTSWTKAKFYEKSLIGKPKTMFDYSGCDAVTMVTTTNALMLALSDRGAGWNSWVVGSGNQNALSGSVKRLERLDDSTDLNVKANAAAKPFGQLPGVNEAPYTFKIVLPVYDKVRLIPIALASSFGNSDPEWLEHKIHHLPIYSVSGPDNLPLDCWYCQQLKVLEMPGFVQEGIDWLNEVDPITKQKLHPCLTTTGGPGQGGTGGVPFAK